MIFTNKTTGTAKDMMLEHLLVEQLKEAYWSEKQLQKSIPVLVRAATGAELQNVLEAHLAETNTHVARLEDIFSILKELPTVRKCVALSGITDQGNALLDATGPGTVARDAALLFITKRIEHYEIATYMALVQLATAQGYTNIAEILYATLEEEMLMDDLLMKIAEKIFNIVMPSP